MMSIPVKQIIVAFLVWYGILSIPESFSQAVTNGKGVTELPDIEVLCGTFRGNCERNFYGKGTPSGLEIIWRFELGKGETVISRRLGSRIWAGAGWTGQPLLVREGSDTFLIQGAFDHKLHKINAKTGIEQWSYSFDDVVKGTGTIWFNPGARDLANSYLILQGSRLGVGNYLDSEFIPSFRAISYLTGLELWRLNVRWAGSYSRDVDGSCLMMGDTAYIGLENGIFTVLDPDPEAARLRDNMLQPRILDETHLYSNEDVEFHNKNVVTESSPALLNNTIYISSGSGHVYGIDPSSADITWDFYTGADMDGSVVVTGDSCLLVSVEKQYIKGRGGVFKLDPSLKPEEAVVWYLETGDTLYESWLGGVIGTAGINDLYIKKDEIPLAVISALDGYTYVVSHTKIDPGHFSTGPDSLTRYSSPVVLEKLATGPSISSPLITDNRIVVAGYNGIFLYEYQNGIAKLLDSYPLMIEATPLIWDDKIYIAARDGFLYCFGENNIK